MLHSRRCEVGVIGAPLRAEALHVLSRFGLNLLLSFGPSMVMVDVVVVDVLRGLPACHQNLSGPLISTKKSRMARGHQNTGLIRGAGTWRVPDDARRLAAGRLQDTGKVLV